MKQWINTGILLMVLVAALQSIMTAIVKAVSNDITTGIQVLAYYIIPLFFIILFSIKQGFSEYGTKQVGFFFLRGIFSAGAVFCFFYVVKHLKVGTAAILFNTKPVFIAIIAYFFL